MQIRICLSIHTKTAPVGQVREAVNGQGTGTVQYGDKNSKGSTVDQGLEG